MELINVTSINSTAPILVNETNINPGGPCDCSFSSPPWYIQMLPELIIIAGVVSLALTIYFSPELRNTLRSVVRWLKK